MPNELTRLLDVITPEIFNQYMRTKTAEKSAFVQSGIAVADERVSRNITSGGFLVNMPFWNDLSGDSEVLGDGEKALSTGKITSSADMAAVLYRGRGWAVNELAAILSGDDPMGALMDRVANYWTREEQKVLISVLNGLFTAGDGIDGKGTLYDTHLLNAASDKISPSLILDTKQLLGDSADKVSMLAMHSAVYTELQKQNLIETIVPSEGKIKIPTYLGYNVCVDDGVPVVDDVFTTFLFATGSIGRNDGNPSELTTFEKARDAAKGNDSIFTRRAITMHPYGVKFTNAERDSNEITPTNIDLAKGENWQRVYEQKNVGILALKHKI